MIKLKAERLRLGMTQMHLAYHAKLTQSELCRIERGWTKPYPGQAARLAQVLGCRPDELLDNVDRIEGIA